jgi:hypothetical protein
MNNYSKIFFCTENESKQTKRNNSQRKKKLIRFETCK